MDFFEHHHGTAIDRAFAQTGAEGHPAMMPAAPVPPQPRKRPVAKPAAPSAPASTSVDANQGSTQSSPDRAGDIISGAPQQASVAASIESLQKQMKETQENATTDPAQQQAIFEKMTGLVGELQSMMAQMAQMQISGNAQAPQQQQQQQQQQDHHHQPQPISQEYHQHQSNHHQQQQQFHRGRGGGGFGGRGGADSTTNGLRTTAKPFNPFSVSSFGGPPQMDQQPMPYDQTQTHSGGRGRQQQQQQPPRGGGVDFPIGYGGDSRWTDHPAPFLGGGGSSAHSRGGAGSAGARGGGYFTPGGPARPTVSCIVEFKRGRMKRFESDAFIKPGNYIIVDGDRGEDCGLAVHTQQNGPDGQVARSETLEGVNLDTTKVKSDRPGDVAPRVRRVADENDVDRLHGEMATLERNALKTCRERVAAMGLEMHIVDCEYQFDRKKITFFFDSSASVDFRELAKDLFKHFGARIWLENINAKVKNVVPPGALSHQDKQVYMERGVRPQR